MPKIKVQHEYPFLDVDGVRYRVPGKVARFCKLLLSAQGEIVSFEQIRASLGTKSQQVVRVYAYNLACLLEPIGWCIVGENKLGYRMYFSSGRAHRYGCVERADKHPSLAA